MISTLYSILIIIPMFFFLMTNRSRGLPLGRCPFAEPSGWRPHGTSDTSFPGARVVLNG